ncbi:hypothetical protein [Flavobacterium sangjuense]|uniref:Uncharacterized protein n=1 Tax=Flavobacterium sangjuense TaxID=2518177 RepID=A0A4P7PSX0_9FLAO|nr:hypothetical protein [Flavobacterium sangjuense]QBZ97340.1 hypothetical protein GS03_00828 [Flavobacterium sangjuense]
MKSSNAIEILNNYFGLMLELNYHTPAEDYFDKMDNVSEFVNLHLNKIKLKQAKSKALYNKKRYEELKSEFEKLKKYGVEELKKLLGNKERLQLQPLFRKFEDLSESDEMEIIDDSDFINFISVLKDKLNDETK